MATRLLPLSSRAPALPSIEHTFGARNFTLTTDAPRTRHAHGQRQTLESRFGAMVIIFATQAIDVQSQACALSKRRHAVWDHLGREVANLFASQAEINGGVWAC